MSLKHSRTEAGEDFQTEMIWRGNAKYQNGGSGGGNQCNGTGKIRKCPCEVSLPRFYEWLRVAEVYVCLFHKVSH